MRPQIFPVQANPVLRRKKSELVGLLVLTLLLTPPLIASVDGASQSLPRVSDSSISYGTVTSNYGSSASIQLKEGAQLYIYGYSAGVGIPRPYQAVPQGASNFAYGQYASAQNSQGFQVASIATTFISTNSFNVLAPLYTIAGVSISDFSSFTASYASNTGAAYATASDTFQVAEPNSLVVIVTIGGDAISAGVMGITGLTTDVYPTLGGELAVAIRHTTLGPGQYTANESVGGDATYSASLIGVFVFAPISSSASSASEPSYVFNGAYADYNVSLTALGITFSLPINYTISHVNAANQSFVVTSKFGTISPYFPGIPINVTASFASPSPFPGASTSELNLLNQGKLPDRWAGASVKRGQSVSVPAGTFSTDQISVTYDTAIWVDSSTGLVVKASGLAPGSTSSTSSGTSLELTRTNIKGPTGAAFLALFGSIWITIGLAVAIAAVAAIGTLWVVKSRRKRTTPSISPVQTPF